eukprot:CAMPEP_0183815510 /NCGR_PEP_ID=MMETSP0803_2-20130417/57049_1 /TAXON_ID=195967 /ORGANISM="Crustomastix stigmata, Strain CCMP3273" /LENGTH=57 /DNA_ID=CAMNT_0026060375 /DNA_START=15 /DNA_END=184 /DNA_ORIENTATION=+
MQQLRALMGEAYLLKMALKRKAADAGDADAQEVTAALDQWIMASHALKKAVGEEDGG